MPRRKKVTTAVTSGDRHASLEALRDRLAIECEADGCSPRDLAAVVKQLTEVMRELEQIKPAQEGSTADDLARRRAERHSGTSGVERAPVRGDVGH